MLPAPDLDRIDQRLARIDLDQWGPDGIRYVCILFWNELGHRMLSHQFDVRAWERWSHSSGEFWDLFLAGCYRYGPAHLYGDRAEALAMDAETCGRVPFRWSRRKSDQLADQVATRARQAGTIRPWDFSGPIELVAVGARRRQQQIDIDWASLRSATMSAHQISDAVAYYTEAHVLGDPELLPESLPSPGDFEDDLPRELLRDLGRHVGLIGKLFRRIAGS
ncbi:MAG: hypothetical protein ACRDTE_32365 [Pseudonocardiaceae bacterium]